MFGISRSPTAAAGGKELVRAGFERSRPGTEWCVQEQLRTHSPGRDFTAPLVALFELPHVQREPAGHNAASEQDPTGADCECQPPLTKDRERDDDNRYGERHEEQRPR